MKAVGKFFYDLGRILFWFGIAWAVGVYIPRLLNYLYGLALVYHIIN